MRFGRNVPLHETFPDATNLMTPSPRRVSLELLTRTTFSRRRSSTSSRRPGSSSWCTTGSCTRRARGRTRTTSRWTKRTPGTSGRCACRRRPPIRPRSLAPRGRRPTSTRTRTGGTARTSMAAVPSAQASLRAGREGKVLVSPSGRLGVDPVDRHRDHRLHRERLGRPQPAARAVRARAQRDLRRAQASTTRSGTTSGCFSRPASSTRRCWRRSIRLSGRPPSFPSGRHHRRAGELVRAVQQAAEHVPAAGRQRLCSAAFPDRRPTITARRSR